LHANRKVSLIAATIQKSAKAITATACYPAYLLQREFYAQTRARMIFIDRHFCAQGKKCRLGTSNEKLTLDEDGISTFSKQKWDHQLMFQRPILTQVGSMFHGK
jgi:hypothetical protein